MSSSFSESIPNAQAQHLSATISTTAQKLTALFPTADPKTRNFVMSIEDATVRLSVNTTAPPATLGQKFLDGDIVELSRGEFESAQVITPTGTATLQLSQYMT